ncbi:MAG: trypsin-like peptidase domain-containing protein, partial [Opitutales bacterium]|nr:trypsin-like peptidase domain-containing protein [Opitutales bacterium]
NHECDLALLKIEDGKFFEGITPMQIGDTPPIRTPVLAAGYPMGGNEISVTQGIISRIECRRYSHSYYGFFLAAQLDAAINPGNSGGPIIFDGKVVGIAFQGNSNGDGIGYMIHSDVIRHFLKDADDGKIDGFGKIGVHIADLINPDARRILKMGAKQSGILVCDVDKTSKSEPRLLENDVITSIDGFAIMNNANVLNERGENVFFKNIADRKRLGDIVKVGILRDGKEFLSEVTLTKPSYKVGPYLFDKRPRYIIAGGFVFSELSLSFLDELGNKVPPNIIDLLGEDNDPVDAETIVLTQVLGDESNMGYQNMGCEILESVNGKKIKTLKELADIVDAQEDGALTFKFESKTKVILDAKHIKDSAQSILKRYNIKSDRNL